MNHGVDRFPRNDPGQLTLPGRSPGRVRGYYPLASQVPGRKRFPGKHSATATRGGRSDAGAEPPRRVAEAPSFLHRPDQAFNEA